PGCCQPPLEETKRLLEPAASPPNKVLNGAEQSYHNLPSARTDEQAMLSSILAKTAMGGGVCVSPPHAVSQHRGGTGPGHHTELGECPAPL
uniref:Uncharacterized protein n=1 Tax=Calidris pygmaea TaxID=425635 RepID=A0A8C3K530_9CHAR